VPPPGTWPAGCRFAPRCRFATDACTAAPIPLAEPEPGRLSRCVRVEQLLEEAVVR